jgi:hypothetical protein
MSATEGTGKLGKEIIMENVIRLIPNIAVSVFAVIVGFNMWFTSEGDAALLALVIIPIGISALEYNITSVLRRRQRRKAN